MPKRLVRLGEAARHVGVSPITLKRWLLLRKVAEVKRDRNGWRFFTTADMARIRRFATSVTRPTKP